MTDETLPAGMDQDLLAVRDLLAADAQHAALALAQGCAPRRYVLAGAQRAAGAPTARAVTVELEAAFERIDEAGLQGRFALAAAYGEVLRPRCTVAGVEFFVPGAEQFTYAALP